EEVPLEEVTKVKPHDVGNYHTPLIGTTVKTHSSNISSTSNHRKTTIQSHTLTEKPNTVNYTKVFKKSMSYIDLKKRNRDPFTHK
ncbi:hypothetical protein NQ315_010938, partial [Exocentrus adspersus]